MNSTLTTAAQWTLLSGLMLGLAACAPPCPKPTPPRCRAPEPGTQPPPTEAPDCARMCTYFTYCRARRWTAPRHLARLILSCTTQCKAKGKGKEASQIFEGIKRCSVNRSCVKMVACLEAFEAKLQAAKPKVDPSAIYRVDVAKSPVRGAPGALVTLVMFSDHQCGFCRRAYAVVRAALKSHPKTLRLVHKHFPLPSHAEGLLGARVSACVMKLKGVSSFWAFHDKAMVTPDLSRASLLAMAKGAGANPKEVARCLARKGGTGAVQADLKLGNDLGIDGTPTFYVNGKRYPGYMSAAELEHAIAEAKLRAEALVKRGVSPAQVYQRLIAGGATSLKYVSPRRPSPGPGSRPRPRR